MLQHIADRVRGMFRPPLSDPNERLAAAIQTARQKQQAEELLARHTYHRKNNHISQRVALAYRLEPRR